MDVIIHTNAEGKIINRQALAEKMLKLKPNHSYTVAIRSVNKTTDRQRGYYFGAVCPLAMQGYQDIGYDEIQTPYQAHKALEKMFCIKSIVNKLTGELIDIPGSIMDLEPQEFNLYLEKVYQFCAEHLYTIIPPPLSQTKLAY